MSDAFQQPAPFREVGGYRRFFGPAMQPALVIFFWPRISTAVPNASFMIDEYKTSKIGKRSRQAWIMQGYVLRRTFFDAHKRIPRGLCSRCLDNQRLSASTISSFQTTQLHSHDIHSQRQQTETEQTLEPQFSASPTGAVTLPAWGFPNDAIFCAQRFVNGSPIAAL